MAPPDESSPVEANPAKVAFCITELEAGGAERALVELVTRLDRRQFQPVVYCLAGRPSGNPISLAERLEAAEVPLTCLGARGVWDLPRSARQLREQMQADRPRIVQTFLFHANVVGAWAARQAGVPSVVTGIRVAERHAAWHLFVARWADRFVDRHVCVSDSVREFSAGPGGLPADKLVVIPNFVETERFEAAGRSIEEIAALKASLGVAEKTPLVVCIGRLDRQKRIEWLLEVMGNVIGQVPDCQLLVVGQGPDRPKLEQLATRQPELRVHFLGARRDVPLVLAASDLLVLPSRWEGMPNVVLEAMASSRAVVATEVEGVRQMLGSQAGEQVVAVDDPNGFAERVTTILRDAQLRDRLGKANFLRAREVFSPLATVSGYEQLYRELLSAGR